MSALSAQKHKSVVYHYRRERIFLNRNGLYTIGQAAKCCGISRSTIIRLEEKGLIEPAFCDESSGYRYYDSNDITKLLQIDHMHAMEMSYDQIKRYYESGGTALEIVRTLEEKFYMIKRTLEEMSIRNGESGTMKAEILKLPEYICYTKDFRGTSYIDKGKNSNITFGEVVEKGYNPLPGEPLFLIVKRFDFLEGSYENMEHDYTCCVPLKPETAPEEAVKIPGCTVLSVLYRGNYENNPEAYIYLGEKMKELGLKAAGYPRGIAYVAPYVGKEIDPNKYVSRFAIPIDDEDLSESAKKLLN